MEHQQQLPFAEKPVDEDCNILPFTPPEFTAMNMISAIHTARIHAALESNSITEDEADELLEDYKEGDDLNRKIELQRRLQGIPADEAGRTELARRTSTRPRMAYWRN